MDPWPITSTRMTKTMDPRGAINSGTGTRELQRIIASVAAAAT